MQVTTHISPSGWFALVPQWHSEWLPFLPGAKATVLPERARSARLGSALPGSGLVTVLVAPLVYFHRMPSIKLLAQGVPSTEAIVKLHNGTVSLCVCDLSRFWWNRFRNFDYTEEINCKPGRRKLKNHTG